MRQFLWMERKRVQNPELQIKYNEFVREYGELGHMHEAKSIPNSVANLYEGLQGKLHEINTRFRLFQYAMTSDVVKMFRQVRIVPEQYDLQRIFWRPPPS